MAKVCRKVKRVYSEKKGGYVKRCADFGGVGNVGALSVRGKAACQRACVEWQSITGAKQGGGKVKRCARFVSAAAVKSGAASKADATRFSESCSIQGDRRSLQKSSKKTKAVGAKKAKAKVTVSVGRGKQQSAQAAAGSSIKITSNGRCMKGGKFIKCPDSVKARIAS